MQLSLADRTYLVTGGGSGIGKGVAIALVDAGARVMIVGRNADRLAAAVSDIEGHAGDGGGAVRYEPTDVTNEDETARAVDAATAWSGRLHGVVHCAGGSETIGPITQIDSDAWRRTVDLNVNGTMYVLKHSARELVRGGGGSFVGDLVDRRQQHPSLVRRVRADEVRDRPLMKVAADELGPSWVRVNGIRPGLIRTELVEPIMQTPAVKDDYLINTPLPRVGEVEDIAMLALFLLSDAAGLDHRAGHQRRRWQSLRRGPDFTRACSSRCSATEGLRGVVNWGACKA